MKKEVSTMSQENPILKNIEKIADKYKGDFQKWEKCYKCLVEAVFEKIDIKRIKEVDGV